jgi:hypothetical protein
MTITDGTFNTWLFHYLLVTILHRCLLSNLSTHRKQFRCSVHGCIYSRYVKLSDESSYLCLEEFKLPASFHQPFKMQKSRHARAQSEYEIKSPPEKLIRSTSGYAFRCVSKLLDASFHSAETRTHEFNGDNV